MKPITEYWKNQAAMEARPTVRNGVASPSLKTIRKAFGGERRRGEVAISGGEGSGGHVREARYLTWPSWPDPETCDEFITIAIFSSGTWNRSDAEVKAALGDGGCHITGQQTVE